MDSSDPSITDKIVHQLKSQGIFDQFRKDCLADVDTKPAYQNLRQRVDSSVVAFLSSHTWGPDLNKNQLRDNLRKFIQNSGFLDVGVERIVDQVVNPKICPLFLPQVEEVVYDCLGVNKPGAAGKPSTSSSTVKTAEKSVITKVTSQFIDEKKQKAVDDGSIVKIKPPSLIEANLLPQDLEPVSPASEDRLVDTIESEDFGEDEEISPPFEPHGDGNSEDSLFSDSHLIDVNSCSTSKVKSETLNCEVTENKNTIVEYVPSNIENDDSEREAEDEDLFSNENEVKSSKSKIEKIKGANDGVRKKPSIKSDYNDICFDEQTSCNVGIGSIGDGNHTVPEKESTKVSKIKQYSQDSDNEISTETSKKSYSDLKTKTSSSGSHHHKKSQSNSSKHSEKDRHHHSHHKHDDRRSSSHSSKTSSKYRHSDSNKKSETKFIDKKEKDYRKHEYIERKHKDKSREDKIKYDKTKTEHKKQRRDSAESTNDHKDKQKEIPSDLKDNIESKKESAHDRKQDRHRRSSKSYTYKNEDHSWNRSGKHINEEMSVPVTNIKDSKKPLERDKRRELSKSKHSKKHCKSSEKFREGRRSSDRDSNGQGESTSSSNNNVFCDSAENYYNASSSHTSDNTVQRYNDNTHKKENVRGENKIVIKKPKKKNSNTYEVIKKIQACKSLERLRKKRTEEEKKVTKDVDVDKDRLGVKSRKEMEQKSDEDSFSIPVITLDSSSENDSFRNSEPKDDDSPKDESPVKSDAKTFTKEHSDGKTKTIYKIPSIFHRKNISHSLNKEEKTYVKSSKEDENKVKARPKIMLNVKEKFKEVWTKHENEPKEVITDENIENSSYALVTLNSPNDISIIPGKSKLNSNIPIIRPLSEIKKLDKLKADSETKIKSKKSDEQVKKKASSRKRHHNTSSSETITNTGQEQDRQNKILKVINHDVKSEEPRHNFSEDEVSQVYASQTDSEEYSPSKPPKLATKLMDVALQDLLLESGLSPASQNEDQGRHNTSSHHRRGTAVKKIKLPTEKPAIIHQQHYDKSDLYKPRPRFTQSSKRSRRIDREASQGDSSLHPPSLGHSSSRR